MFQVEVAGQAVIITMSRSPVNAISNEWLENFHKALDSIEGRDSVSVLHIRSDQRVFCAGADLKQIATRFDDGPDVWVSDVRAIHGLFDRIEALPFVTLAEIHGAALGGGFELAMSCDLRIAAANAQIGLPEARLGLIPGAGGTQRLTRLCGPGVASRIILGCDVVDGATACALGMVQWAASPQELSGQAVAIRDRIAGLSASALRVSKRCISAQGDPNSNGFALEIDSQRGLIASMEARSRVSAFLAGRASRQSKKGEDE